MSLVERMENYDLLPPGVYTLQLKNMVPYIAKSSGREMWKFSFTIISPPQYAGRSLLPQYIAKGMKPGNYLNKLYMALVGNSINISIGEEVNWSICIGRQVNAMISIAKKNNGDGDENKIVQYMAVE